MATVKMGVGRLSGTELVPKAQAIHDGMDANVLFPVPVPTTAEFQLQIKALAAANALVDAERSKSAYSARNAAEKLVRATLKSWAGYVQMASGGDADKILTSNFEVSKRGEPIGELNPPSKLSTALTRTSNRVSLNWPREEGADMYHVYICTEQAPEKWELLAATTKSRFNVDNLEAGKFYWFAVSAIGAAGESSKSEPCRAMAAA
jgi:hypothetical protein